MNKKFWLVVFLLCSLILLLGGMRHPAHPAEANAAEPVVRDAEAAVSQTVGSPAEWQKAARRKPLWILQIEAVCE